jgi:hypothetical protein
MTFKNGSLNTREQQQKEKDKEKEKEKKFYQMVALTLVPWLSPPENST